MAFKGKKPADNRDESVKSEIMHRLKTHPFLFIGTVVILVIVIVAFVFVPAIVPNVYHGEELVFGYYNKTPVKYVQNNYFYEVQQNLSHQYQMPSSDDPSYLYMMNRIWRQAFDSTVVHMGVLDEMKQAGFIIPEDVVDRNVAELPMFQENGRFSASKYRAMDNNSRMNLWRQVQDSVAVNAYLSDMSGLRISSKETRFISSMSSPRRSFDLAVFPFESYPDTEVVSYAQANRDLFRVTHFSRITINSSEREAKQVLESVKSGTTTFEEAAKSNSQDEYADRGGDMGIRMAHELLSEISDEQTREGVINLPRGGLSGLVKAASGWAFYRAEEAVQQADLNDVSQREKIRNYIMVYSRGRAEDWLFVEAGKFSARVREMGFDEAIAAGGITKHSFGPVPVNYGGSALFSSVSSAGISELSGADTNQRFWKQAFSTPVNAVSQPIVMWNNVIVLYPTEETYADENEDQWLASYFPYWLYESMDQVYQSYFMNNEKLEDRFDELFWKLFGGS